MFTPKPKDVDELNAGEIGFITTGIKVLSETKVGDTICDQKNHCKKLCQDLSQANQLFFVGCFQWIVQNIKN